ncbi:hypothetical protein HK104_001886 [Borealophlyctis nickersoniae]|nr:hypothetical protein HK104_001886 [Borealophlyctis nickersoniae]
MASSPLHHIPLRAAANVLENVRNPRVSDAPSLTGPAPWTDAIYSHWKEYGVDPEELRAFGNKGRVVGDSLILPITGFSPGLGQVLITIFGDMGAGKIEDPEARVRHLWKGTWRS